jgi:hypothetical protein
VPENSADSPSPLAADLQLLDAALRASGYDVCGVFRNDVGGESCVGFHLSSRPDERPKSEIHTSLQKRWAGALEDAPPDVVDALGRARFTHSIIVDRDTCGQLAIMQRIAFPGELLAFVTAQLATLPAPHPVRAEATAETASEPAPGTASERIDLTGADLASGNLDSPSAPEPLITDVLEEPATGMQSSSRAGSALDDVFFGEIPQQRPSRNVSNRLGAEALRKDRPTRLEPGERAPERRPAARQADRAQDGQAHTSARQLIHIDRPRRSPGAGDMDRFEWVERARRACEPTPDHYVLPVLDDLLARAGYEVAGQTSWAEGVEGCPSVQFTLTSHLRADDLCNRLNASWTTHSRDSEGWSHYYWVCELSNSQHTRRGFRSHVRFIVPEGEVDLIVDLLEDIAHQRRRHRQATDAFASDSASLA